MASGLNTTGKPIDNSFVNPNSKLQDSISNNSNLKSESSTSDLIILSKQNNGNSGKPDDVVTNTNSTAAEAKFSNPLNTSKNTKANSDNPISRTETPVSEKSTIIKSYGFFKNLRYPSSQAINQAYNAGLKSNQSQAISKLSSDISSVVNNETKDSTSSLISANFKNNINDKFVSDSSSENFDSAKKKIDFTTKPDGNSVNIDSLRSDVNNLNGSNISFRQPQQSVNGLLYDSPTITFGRFGEILMYHPSNPDRTMLASAISPVISNFNDGSNSTSTLIPSIANSNSNGLLVTTAKTIDSIVKVASVAIPDNINISPNDFTQKNSLFNLNQKQANNKYSSGILTGLNQDENRTIFSNKKEKQFGVQNFLGEKSDSLIGNNVSVFIKPKADPSSLNSYYKEKFSGTDNNQNSLTPSNKSNSNKNSLVLEFNKKTSFEDSLVPSQNEKDNSTVGFNSSTLNNAFRNGLLSVYNNDQESNASFSSFNQVESQFNF